MACYRDSFTLLYFYFYTAIRDDLGDNKLVYFRVGSDVFTEVTMTNAVFLDVAPCKCCANRRGCSHLLTLVPHLRIFYT